MAKRRETLQRMLRDDKIYILPGVFECIGALVAEQAGFPAIGVTGNGLSASAIGMPDFGLMSMAEVVERSRQIASAVGIPVIADADTGYGGTLSVYRTVREFEQTGVAGIHLEDQASPKKCAYYQADQKLISTDDFVAKIKAATAARQDKAFALVIRTDAYRLRGLAETVERCRLYAAAGADMLFVVGLTSLEDIRAISAATPVPLMVNTNDGDKLAAIPLDELRAAGVKIIAYPATVRSAMVKAVETALRALAADGNTNKVLPALAPISGLSELTRLAHYQALEHSWETGE
ncbi:MAG: isocitrate lyase/PEP mutase family protein [Negativicutes bacterium]|nr:isocitrate lyase/PEP mutase family protein [Negativicutes bacterium]